MNELLNRLPIGRKILFLQTCRQVHQNVVANLVALGQINARRIDALENQLRIVISRQFNVYDLKFLDGLDNLIDRNLIRQDTLHKVIIVLGNMRIGDSHSSIFGEKLGERLAIILNRLQFDARLFRLELVDQILLVNPLRQIRIRRIHRTRLQQIVNRQKQQRNRGQTLLSIHHKELRRPSARLVDRNDAAEEVRPPTSPLDLHQIVEQLLAVFLLPVVVPLIDRDDEPLLRSVHKLYQPRLIAFHKENTSINRVLN